jgi:glycosyltransferase involved in cell wall biosynthesis
MLRAAGLARTEDLDMQNHPMPEEEQQHLSGLRVLWVSHGYGYGGDLMYFGEIFSRFRTIFPKTEIGIDEDTIYKNPYDIKLTTIAKFFRFPIKRLGDEGQIYEMETVFPSPSMFLELMKNPADVFVTIEFTAPALFTTLVAALSKRRRLVLLVESDPAPRGGSKNWLVRLIKRWAVSQADVIQTNNDKGKRYLVEDLGAAPIKIRVAPYLTSRPPGPEVEIPAPKGPLRVLFANSIAPRKGLRQLINALLRLPSATLDNVALTVVGDGPERRELELAAAELNMGERLQFVGRRAYSELGPYYSAAEVLAVPSLADYRSLAGFEGLGYGLALLSSRYDGATEETIPVDGTTGYVIDPLDRDSFASAIEKLVGNRDLVASMRRSAADLYRSAYSLERITQNLRETVEAAL